jgi:hypothetical protein
MCSRGEHCQNISYFWSLMCLESFVSQKGRAATVMKLTATFEVDTLFVRYKICFCSVHRRVISCWRPIAVRLTPPVWSWRSAPSRVSTAHSRLTSPPGYSPRPARSSSTRSNHCLFIRGPMCSMTTGHVICPFFGYDLVHVFDDNRSSYLSFNWLKCLYLMITDIVICFCIWWQEVL